MPDAHDDTNLEKAIAEHLGSYDGNHPIVTRWLLVAEALDPETGENQLHMIRPPGLALWDALGMLTYMTEFSKLRIEKGDD